MRMKREFIRGIHFTVNFLNPPAVQIAITACVSIPGAVHQKFERHEIKIE
jgi:hypothetical protein